MVLLFPALPVAHIHVASLVYRVLNRNRRPLGYVDVAKLKKVWESGKANPVRSNFPLHANLIHDKAHSAQEDKVSQYMIHFNRSSNQPYTIITPLTPLTELEEFLKRNIFALGAWPFGFPLCFWN